MSNFGVICITKCQRASECFFLNLLLVSRSIVFIVKESDCAI